ncbi:MAG TPA: DUF1127 domain-containing protein [Stellaceae bacterium]|jgi:uncharacterized protein YjiS (DUF1127 family)|nr:DUF1127 domain-containing protein [Stellaceae bacterium]
MADIDLGRLTISQGQEGLVRLLGVVGQWRRRARDRAELARFDERSLRDIGVSPAQARDEADKPFWRA